MDLWWIVNCFEAANVAVQAANLSTVEHEFRNQNYQRYSNSLSIRHALVLNLLAHIGHASLEVEQAGLNEDVLLFNAMRERIERTTLNDSELATEAINAKAILKGALNKIRFLYVAADRCQYLDQNALFGDRVRAAFPSANADIREAGNCLAAECNTASVFHLMRVAEHGLRALARDRRIKVPKGSIELATWDEIIRQLEDAERAIQHYPKTLAREVQFEFYHGALMEFRRFKNKFRNRIMHTRHEYDRDEAHSAMAHVRDFMNILASRISETRRAPIIWKRASP